MTGCLCHEAAVFGHVRRDCPATMVPPGQRRSDGHVAVHEPLAAEPDEVSATIGQLADRRRRVLARLFTS